MDPLKDSLKKPADHRLYVSENSYAVFGESTVGGKLTKNCYHHMRELNCFIPDRFSEILSDEIIIGENEFFC